jgi:hypothetical protein
LKKAVENSILSNPPMAHLSDERSPELPGAKPHNVGEHKLDNPRAGRPPARGAGGIRRDPPPPRRRSANLGGRPCKLTVRVALAIVSAICRGANLDEAARAGGVSPSTLYRWLQAGKRGDPRYSPLVEAIRTSRSNGLFLRPWG